MQPPPLPPDEGRRLDTLRAYQVLDTLPEQAFDDLTALAAQICDAPISLISLVDGHRQWFKSKIGTTLEDTAREISFCGHTILDADVMVVPDASLDDRFADNPLVTGDLHIRFYAGAPLRSPDGHALGALCVMDRVPHRFNDSQREALQTLSRQVMAQLELRYHTRALIESEAQLRLYAEHTPAAVAMFDHEMRYLVASRRWMEDYKLGDTPILGRTHYDVFPDVPDRWRAIHQRCLGGAVEACDEDPFERADGSIEWIRWEIRPWRQAGGAIGGIIMFTDVITGRKARDSALRASEARYRAIFDLAPDGILVADDGNVYVDVNQSICGMLGYSRDELLRLQTSDVLIPSDVHYIAPARAAVMASERMHRQWTFQRKDGTTFPADVVATRMPDGVRMAMVRDVSARHALEAQYLQAQKMEAIGRLAGGVAHDFNNLLTSILGNCELLVDRLEPGDPGLEDVAAIQRAGTTAAGLTRQLLAFSRKQIIEPVRLDVNEVVRELRTMLARLIGEDIRIDLDLCAGPATITADRGQIEQVLLNLAVNSRDAMPAGGRLTIRTACLDLDEQQAAGAGMAAGPVVTLAVTDTGVGMTSDVQAHLFEPFFTTKEPGRGTGLGLATVHGIVTRAGGSIRVESAIGAGATFSFCFPRCAAAPSADEGANDGPGRGAARTVLVVEDSADLGRLTRRLLERIGYRVLLAASAGEAATLFEAHPEVDVLLTDVVMPGGSGPDLTRMLRVRRPDLHVVYMSGYTEDAIVQHGVLQPGIAFLNKPFSSRSLDQKLREVLDA
jgi:two-component system cell cycle sensor histidine kinase/response regulator CckA